MYRSMAFAVLMLCLTAGVQAQPLVTYILSGPNYSGASGVFDNTMTLSGSFTTASPLAANLSSQAVGALVTDYAFNDGVNNYTPANSLVLYDNPVFFSVSTDAAGNITGYLISLMSPLPPHTGIEAFNAFLINGSNITAGAGQTCGDVVDQICRSLPPGASGNVTGAFPGVFTAQVTSSAATPVPVPVFSAWGIGVLAILLAFCGLLMTRRKVHQAG